MFMEPKLIFLAGSYRSNNGADGTYENLYQQRKIYKTLWRNGLPTISCNLSSAFMDGFITDFESFIKGTTQIMLRCDLVIFAPNSQNSEGCRAEKEQAIKAGIPVIEMDDFKREDLDGYIEHLLSVLWERGLR